MLRTFYDASHLDKTRRETSLAGRPPQQTTTPPTAMTLRSIGVAFREGLASCRQYEELRSNGVPRDAAVREALGLGLIPSQARHQSAKPLSFAGRA
jgi:hypothetical protein